MSEHSNVGYNSESKEYRDRLENLDVLIAEKDCLRLLTENDAWPILLGRLAELRVDAMDLAIAEGDTTDAKAYARVLGVLMNFFYSLDSTVELDDLVGQRELLKQEIAIIDKSRREEYSTSIGLGVTI